MILYLLIALWCGYVYLTIPAESNPYNYGERFWLAFKLFGGRRGKVMLLGFLAICFAYGLLFH